MDSENNFFAILSSELKRYEPFYNYTERQCFINTIKDQMSMSEPINAKTFNPIADRINRDRVKEVEDAKTTALAQFTDLELVEALRNRGFKVIATKDVEEVVTTHIEL